MKLSITACLSFVPRLVLAAALLPASAGVLAQSKRRATATSHLWKIGRAGWVN